MLTLDVSDVQYLAGIRLPCLIPLAVARPREKEQD